MIEVNETIQVPESELSWSFARASGPGGQNVNKVASKAVLRWNPAESSALSDEVKRRFASLHRNRMTKEGELVVTSQRYRDQDRNRQDCLEKLCALVIQATFRPKVRKKTKPSKASRERRLVAKKQRAQVKQRRRAPTRDD